MDNKTIKFNSQITEVDNINPMFSKVKIRIAYTGVNRNGSYFTKESFEKAIPSIYNVPIIGEYYEEANDFGTHGGKIIIDSKGIKYVQTTIPYGIINESSDITWEEITEEDGTVNEYLCATGYLWTGRYPELEMILNKQFSQSMEVDVVNSEFTEIDGQQVFNITDFNFSGFCILGSDVEPCFQSASISAYSLDFKDFKQLFTQMVNELKFSLNQSFSKEKVDIDTQEGGNILDEKLALLEKYQFTLDMLKEKEIDIEQFSLEELEQKLIEFTKVEEHEVTPEPETKFSLTHNQLESEIRKVLSSRKVIVKDYWGDAYEENEFYFRDIKDELVIVIDNQWENYYGIPFTVNGDTVELDFDNKIPYVSDWRPKVDSDATNTFAKEEFEAKFNLFIEKSKEHFNVKETEEYTKLNTEFEQLQTEFNKAKENYSTLETEVTELRKFQQDKLQEERTEQENTLFEQFSTQLSDEELNSIKEIKDQFSIEELEEKLFVLVGKKNAKFNRQVKKESTKIVVTPIVETTDEPYGSLSSYFKKN